MSEEAVPHGIQIRDNGDRITFHIDRMDRGERRPFQPEVFIDLTVGEVRVYANDDQGNRYFRGYINI